MTDMKLWVIGKNSLIVLTIFTIALYVLSFCFNGSDDDLFRFGGVFDQDLRFANTTKKILYWTKMFSSETFYMGTGYIARDCPVNDCYATNNRHMVNPTDFDAVLFHGNDLNLEDLPKNRSPRQWYVFVNLESPANRPMTNYFYEDFFNITMTYRLDSDIVWTYAVVKDARTNVNVAPSRNVNWSAFYAGSGNRTIAYDVDASLSKTIRGKTKPIIWFVSNCMAKSGREEYVNELSKHIPVDVYGKCGNMFCPRNEDCFARVVEPGYFFYLSFENSLCDDYVTEKLYNSLRYNVVPIVYGGANYSRYAPPRSYIDVFDFDTPKSLAEYLKELIKNPRKYSEYFAWKTYYKIEDGVQQGVCNLCEFLHKQKQPRTQTFLSDWFSRSKCHLQEFLRDRSYLTGSIFKD
ncbi:alpha-(1,3)-fucosyltransferase C-like [Bombus vosnesenskii]|uniref:Fucosyltransferase n=1 Tax=Bombus vosnesenskii TaxID=207650 RepID=A0A6J3LC97_9HYME|nr:alpha-(1,3)-fucosyltransferase C-like [Bombus vosnesenskii]XP_033362951.1 alpha-(1,3)-fucosyltransferase C-like [Bombus vosnesenskii]XP_033362957.1 alpha-(1,3)-fucosyltransferase C-like [Bombus vosnesenskii]XP_033362963.1 alpha-(1,3)-fucosyltransferase C-like [Bombus vosnesenskii]